MIYLKSVLAGLLAAVVVSIALLALGFLGVVVYTAMKTPPDMSVGWDPISLTKRPPFLAIAFFIVCFAAGSFWGFRRLSHH